MGYVISEYDNDVEEVRLPPAHGRGQYTTGSCVAVDIEKPWMRHAVHLLISYGTIVASICDGQLRRHWDSWSRTTSKHIGSFCLHYGVNNTWSKQECAPLDEVLFGTSEHSILSEAKAEKGRLKSLYLRLEI